jgi:hypothetical protein
MKPYRGDAGGGTRTPDTRIMNLRWQFSGGCGWSANWLEKQVCADPNFGHFPVPGHAVDLMLI